MRGVVRCALCGTAFPATEDVVRRANTLRRKNSPYVCMRCEARQAYEIGKGRRSKGGF